MEILEKFDLLSMIEPSFTWSLFLCVCCVDRCLFFCPFSFGHCVVCLSLFDLWILTTPLVSSNSSFLWIKSWNRRTCSLAETWCIVYPRYLHSQIGTSPLHLLPSHVNNLFPVNFNGGSHLKVKTAPSFFFVAVRLTVGSISLQPFPVKQKWRHNKSSTRVHADM